MRITQLSERVDFDDSLGVADVDRLAGSAALRVVQTASPVEDATWRVLNEHLFAVRRDVELRVYGHHGGTCDLRFLRFLPDVRRFRADCLQTAEHLEAVASLPLLEHLGIGIHNAVSFDFLHHVPHTLRLLALGATRSKKPDLAPLRRFRELAVLHLERQHRHIEVLAELGSLENVTLRSITTQDLSYLGSLDKLWSLDIKLGGIRDLEAIQGLERLKYLELWQVRGLSDLAVVSHWLACRTSSCSPCHVSERCHRCTAFVRCVASVWRT